MQHRVWGGIALAALGWGTAGVATRAALEEGVPPFAIALYRSVLAAVIVAAFISARAAWQRPDRQTVQLSMVMAVLNLAAPFLLSTLALQYASAGFVGLLASLIPLMTAVLAHLMLPDEPLRPAKVWGLLVALAGVAVLVLSGDSGLEEGGRPGVALLLGLTSVVVIAFAGIYAKRRSGSYDPIEMTGLQFAFGTLFLGAAMLVVEGPSIGYGATGWALLGYMALAGGFVPFVLFYWLLRHVSASYASIIGYLVPLVAVIAGILFLDERLQPGIAFGGLLILAGVIVTDRAEARWVRAMGGAGGGVLPPGATGDPVAGPQQPGSDEQ